MATILKRKTSKGEVRYQVLVRLRGHPQATATFERLTDARRWAADTTAGIREGRYFRISEARRHTLAELVDRYLTDVAPTKPKGQGKARQLLGWWRGQLGALTLDQVTPAVIAEERDALARGETPRGSRRSAATTTRYLAAISHAFTIAAREWGWVEENPVRKVRRLPEPRGRVRCLTDEERAALLAACQASDDPRLYPLAVLALSTGARQGELLGLRWPDVDLERGLAVAHETKNQDRRALPIASLAADLLRDLKRRRRLDTDLVFAAPNGRATFPRRAWAAALRDSGVRDFRWHDLRHCCASYLAMNGATLAEIAEVLGHRTLQMVKRYSHMTDTHVSAVVARMNERIFGGGA